MGQRKFQSLHEKLDTTTAGGMFVFHVFAALAEFIRTIIVANTDEGLAVARACGQRFGRLDRLESRAAAGSGRALPEAE